MDVAVCQDEPSESYAGQALISLIAEKRVRNAIVEELWLSPINDRTIRIRHYLLGIYEQKDAE